MERRITTLVAVTVVLAGVMVSACGGAAPSPAATTAPAAAVPTTAPAVAAPTTAPAAPATAPTSAPTTAAISPTTAASPAATTAAPGATTGNVAAGKTVFDQYCNACHPNGQKGVGPALVGRNLSASRIQTQVRNGGGSMPAFSSSQISDQQLSDLVAYIQSLK